jgi:hypothetical protein
MLAARQPRPPELTTTVDLGLSELLEGQRRGDAVKGGARPRPHAARPPTLTSSCRADPPPAPAKDEPEEPTWLLKHLCRQRCDGGGGGTRPVLREDEPDEESCTRDVDNRGTPRHRGSLLCLICGGERVKLAPSTARHGRNSLLKEGDGGGGVVGGGGRRSPRG